MYPTLTIFNKTFGTYTLISLVGVFAAGIFACRTARRRGCDDNDMLVLLLVAAFGGLVGSHLLYGIVNYPLLFDFLDELDQIHSLRDFFGRMQWIFGGAVYYGGLLGGIWAGTLYARKKGLPLPLFSDIIAPAIALFHVFGRIGCFFGGCCYGVECRFGFTYTRALLAEANFVRRFPVQLAEAAFNLLLFLLLAGLLRKKVLPGRLFYLYLMLYAAGRFVLEFWRGDALRGVLYGLSTSQWLGIAIFAVAAWRFFLPSAHRGESGETPSAGVS